MLNCILGMVDKTKRALSILQQRNGLHSPPQSNSDNKPAASSPPEQFNPRGGALLPQDEAPGGGPGGAVKHGQHLQLNGVDQQQGLFRKPISEILATTIKNTEARVVEVKRKAEEAVLEVGSTV